MRLFVCCLIGVFIFFAVSSVFAQTRGKGELEIIAQDGTKVAEFGEAHALVIGESNYNNGWPQLLSVKDDVIAVRKLFEGQKFNVKTIEDKPGNELKAEIESFLKNYGHIENARLIIYFAGHGDTQTLPTGRKMGYIVPVDAPLYSANRSDFLQKAIPMLQFDAWSKQYGCRHILFIFDSCFAGTIFDTRGTSGVPPVITSHIARPVRQFITSGSENETVPEPSVFRPLLERALLDREADKNNDGYVTGTELGMYLSDEVINREKGKWHPKYGKSHDIDLDKGDFVFAVGKPQSAPAVVPPPSPIISPTVGSITITSEIAGELLIDGAVKRVIKANEVVTVDNITTGTTEVAVRESNGKITKAHQAVIVKQGQTVSALIKSPVGSLRISTVTAGTLTIQGQQSFPAERFNANESKNKTQIKPGVYQITMTYTDGAQTETKTVTVTADKTESVAFSNVKPIPQPLPAEPVKNIKEKREKMNRFNSIGGFIGTTFSIPAVVVTIKGTYAPINNFFIEGGLDFGFGPTYEEVKQYYSFYPYGNINYVFIDDDSSIFYGGIGAGYMLSTYKLENRDVERNTAAMNFILGVWFLNIVDISLLFRTNFDNSQFKISAGVTYRFK